MSQKILVVEDDLSLSNVIDIKLKKEGYEIFVVRSVEEAAEVLKNHSIDLVWLDHYLVGESSGLDLVVMMKEQKSDWNKIPIFVVSNTASSEKVKSYINLGIDKFYVKAQTSLEDIVQDIKAVI